MRGLEYLREEVARVRLADLDGAEIRAAIERSRHGGDPGTDRLDSHCFWKIWLASCFCWQLSKGREDVGCIRVCTHCKRSCSRAAP